MSFSITRKIAVCAALLLTSFASSESTPMAVEPSPSAAQADPSKKLVRTVTLNVEVPAGTGTVYLTGNLAELGPWDAARFPLSGTGTRRTATLQIPDGTQFLFKFTLGSWEREALGPSGTMLPNHRLDVNGDVTADYTIVDFKRGTAEFLDSLEGAGIKGRLIYIKDVTSKFLEKSRHVEVWLPPGYDADPNRRWPVLYMHDGQNLFDPRIAATGTDWGVDESIVRLTEAGKIDPPIVVGIWNTELRRQEYSPWGIGPAYARFLIEELKPRIDREYRTLTDTKHTAVMGSSMGGLISFYLVRNHSDVFGSAGCLSTHWPWNGSPDLLFLKPGLIMSELNTKFSYPKGTRTYFDYGTATLDAAYEPYQTKVTAWLKRQGFVEGTDFVVRKFEGAPHSESAWRERLDVPMQFLFGK